MSLARRSDSDIQRDVLERLRADDRIPETDIGVTVHQSVVTLTGFVHGFAIKTAAQEIAHRVGGVLDVVNDLEVDKGGYGVPDDTSLAHSIRAALEAASDVPHRQVHTTVSRGMVTLEGCVSTTAQRERIAMLVRNIRGVVRVLDQLDVAAATTQSVLGAAEAR